MSDTVLGSMGGGVSKTNSAFKLTAEPRRRRQLTKKHSQDGDTLSREKEARTGREVLGMWR